MFVYLWFGAVEIWVVEFEDSCFFLLSLVGNLRLVITWMSKAIVNLFSYLE